MWIHKHYNTGEILDETRSKFRESFEKNPSTHKTMSKLEIKLFETENMKDASHSRRL